MSASGETFAVTTQSSEDEANSKSADVPHIVVDVAPSAEEPTQSSMDTGLNPSSTEVVGLSPQISVDSVGEDGWSCTICTLRNHAEATRCMACETPRCQEVLRQESCASALSWASAESDDEVELQPNPTLLRDVDRYQQLYHSEVGLQYVADEARISLVIDTSHFNARIANAWGLSIEEPIQLRFHLSKELYVDHPLLDKIEVWQEGVAEKKAKVCAQIHAILKVYIRRCIGSLSCESVDAAAEELDPDWRELNLLMALGFTRLESIQALDASDNRFDDAKEFLMENTDADEETPASHRLPTRLPFGLLCHLVEYVQYRLSTVNEYCVNCDIRHYGNAANMLMPAVCHRGVCLFGFMEMGVGRKVQPLYSLSTNTTKAASDYVGSEKDELLYLFTRIAANSSRHELIFQPFPQIPRFGDVFDCLS